MLNDCTKKKILKSQYILKNFILFHIQLICLPPNFQYKSGPWQELELPYAHIAYLT